MKQYLYLCLALAWAVPLAYAQEQRLELNIGKSSQMHYVIPVADYGTVMLTGKNQSAETNEKQWLLTHFENDLEKHGDYHFSISPSMAYKGHDVDGSQVYLLFYQPASGIYQFAVFDLLTKNIEQQKIQGLNKVAVETIKVINGQVFLAGSYDSTPMLMHFNLQEAPYQLKILPTATSKKSQMAMLDKDATSGLVSYSFSEWARGKSQLAVQIYDANGEMLDRLSIPSAEGKNLLMGKMSITEKGDALIIGTYSSNSQKLANGLYITRYNGQEQSHIRFYNFANLSHFLDYLPESQQERIAKRQKRKISKNKTLNLDHRLLIHDIIQRDGTYLMLAEAYYPTYQYKPAGYAKQFKSKGMGRTRAAFDGYRYTHAMLAGFSEDGELIWDNSIPLEHPKIDELRQLVHIGFTKENHILMTYNQKGVLLGKRISGHQTLDGTREIKLSKTTQHLPKQHYTSYVSAWNNGHFIAWGKQGIKNSEKGIAEKQNTVLYINRVPFELFD